jgi:hypothetical protein
VKLGGSKQQTNTKLPPIVCSARSTLKTEIEVVAYAATGVRNHFSNIQPI